MFTSPSNNKWYLTTTAILFTVIAAAHLSIIIWQMQASVGGNAIPYWVNGLAVVVLGYLAARGFMAAHKL